MENVLQPTYVIRDDYQCVKFAHLFFLLFSLDFTCMGWGPSGRDNQTVDEEMHPLSKKAPDWNFFF